MQPLNDGIERLVSAQPTSRRDHLLQTIVDKRTYFSSQQAPCSKYSNEPRLVPVQKPQPVAQSVAPSAISPIRMLVSRFQRRSGRLHVGFSDPWKEGALRVIYYVSRFLAVLKTSTHQYRFKLINKKIFNILGDQASDYKFYYLGGRLREKPNKFTKMWTALLEFGSKILGTNLHKMYRHNLYDRSIGVLQPDGYFKIIFDIILLLFLVLNIFYIPMKLCFELNQHGTENNVSDVFLETLPSIIFIMEVLINFNTSYYDRGLLHEDRGKIMRHYLRGDFIWDLVVILPFLISRFNIQYIDFVLLLRVRRVSKIVESLEELTSVREKFAAVIDLSKLFFLLVFVSHICGCAWHYLGILQMRAGIDQCWIRKYNLEFASWQERYITSFYWSTITTLTVGYGDIVPSNYYERTFVTCTVLITSIVFGYTISSIGQIFSQMSQKNDTFKEKMTMISVYLKRRHMSHALQVKVKKYFEYYFKNILVQHPHPYLQDSNDECDKLMERLTNELKRDVKTDIHKHTLKSCQLLQESFSEAFLRDLSQKLHVVRYNPGDLMFQQNSIVDKLTFVLMGEVKVFVSREENHDNKLLPIYLRSFFKGYVIGTKNFLLEKPTEYLGVAHGFTEVAYITFEDFSNCLQMHPQDYQAFSVIRENLLYNQYYKKVVDVCPVCSSNHQLIRCPFTFFQPNKTKIISDKRTRDTINLRSAFHRQPNHTGSFRHYREDLQENILNYLIEKQYLSEHEVNAEMQEKFGLTLMAHDSKQLDDPRERSHSRDRDEKSMRVRLFDIGKRQSVEMQNLLLQPHYSNKPPGSNNGSIVRNQRRRSFLRDSHDLDESPDLQEEPDGVSQMHIIKMEYLKLIHEDQIPELDTHHDYPHYFKNFNLQNVIMKLNKMNDSTVKSKNRRLIVQRRNRGTIDQVPSKNFIFMPGSFVARTRQ